MDTNVFLYARGFDHPYRQPCRTVLEAAGNGRVRLVASVGLVQEFIHVLLRRGVPGDEALEEAEEVWRQCQVHPFDEAVLMRVFGLLRQYPRLGVRDAVHVATALAIGVPQVLSADQVFDSIVEIDRIDPVSAAALLH